MQNRYNNIKETKQTRRRCKQRLLFIRKSIIIYWIHFKLFNKNQCHKKTQNKSTINYSRRILLQIITILIKEKRSLKAIKRKGEKGKFDLLKCIISICFLKLMWNVEWKWSLKYCVMEQCLPLAKYAFLIWKQIQCLIKNENVIKIN